MQVPMQFNITAEQYQRYLAWEKEQDKLVHQTQKNAEEAKKNNVCDWCNGSGIFYDKSNTYWKKFIDWVNPKIYPTLICEGCQGDKKYHSSPVIASCIKDGRGFYGAIGGYITWEFTPTSAATFIAVKHSITNNILHLTDDLDL